MGHFFIWVIPISRVQIQHDYVKKLKENNTGKEQNCQDIQGQEGGQFPLMSLLGLTLSQEQHFKGHWGLLWEEEKAGKLCF